MYRIYTGKIMRTIKRISTHSLFCALNFIMPTCRPNPAEVARSTYSLNRFGVVGACGRLNFHWNSSVVSTGGKE